LPEILRRIAANRVIIYSLVLIALMLLRPQGLFGRLPRRGIPVGSATKPAKLPAGS
jgi:ABC-type branched-subunit amino acid transport system permease subunit